LANIDPRLRAKIEAAGKDENIKMIISLAKESDPKLIGPQAKAQDKLVEDLLIRTQNATDEKPKQVKHLQNIGVLMVEGNAPFCRKLLDNPEVSSATISEDQDVVKA
jgi:hypothetical protein